MKTTKTNFVRFHFLRFGLESIRKSIKVFLLWHLHAVPLYSNFLCTSFIWTTLKQCLLPSQLWIYKKKFPGYLRYCLCPRGWCEDHVRWVRAESEAGGWDICWNGRRSPGRRSRTRPPPCLAHSHIQNAKRPAPVLYVNEKNSLAKLRIDNFLIFQKTIIFLNVISNRSSKRFLPPEKMSPFDFKILRNLIISCLSQRSWRLYDHQTANVLHIICCLLSSYVAYRRYLVFYRRYFIFHPRYYICHRRYRTFVNLLCCFVFLVSKWKKTVWPWNSGLL